MKVLKMKFMFKISSMTLRYHKKLLVRKKISYITINYSLENDTTAGTGKKNYKTFVASEKLRLIKNIQNSTVL